MQTKTSRFDRVSGDFEYGTLSVFFVLTQINFLGSTDVGKF